MQKLGKEIAKREFLKQLENQVIFENKKSRNFKNKEDFFKYVTRFKSEHSCAIGLRREPTTVHRFDGTIAR